MFEKIRKKDFDILTLHHAEAILNHDMPDAVKELEAILNEFVIPISELVRGGGGETMLTQRIRHRLSDDYSWNKHKFEIKKTVDGKEKESISHEIDHVKYFKGGTIALEIEWNNKDPFYDRDLENFKRLHGDGVISVGVIITRGRSLQDSMRNLIETFATNNGIDSIDKLEPYYSPTSRQKSNIMRASASKGSFQSGWAHSFVSDKYGEATTHWKKLEDRVRRGVGNPCPLLLIGIPNSIVDISR